MNIEPITPQPVDTFQITQAIERCGWIVVENYLSPAHCQLLSERAGTIDYQPAHIGRGDDLQRNSALRKDHIHWLTPNEPVDRIWLEAMENLRVTLNSTLFMGLFEFECHYACYQPGAFYRRHKDAFVGEGNRLLSVVLYLNEHWHPTQGGQMILYHPDESVAYSVQPEAGTVALFLSEEFPHEVLPADRIRYSIAGWFRINNSTSERVDPPR